MLHLQHGRLDLDETVGGERVAQAPVDPGAGEHGLARLIAGDEIEEPAADAALLAQFRIEVRQGQQRLGGETKTIEALNQLLAKQERDRQRFATVETMFTSNQASVLRRGDNVIIRMIGLNLDSGTAYLEPEHADILTTLENGIGVFPECRVVVEGHTDAFGSDQQNLQLSQQRAKTVVDHLLTSMPISPMNLASQGFGDSRPVANNETSEGRMRNRRIDVVIEPSW